MQDFLRFANAWAKITSLAQVGRGIAMKEMKKGEIPEAFERLSMESTRGYAMKAEITRPPISQQTDLQMMWVLDGALALSSSSLSVLSTSSKEIKVDIASCSTTSTVNCVHEPVKDPKLLEIFYWLCLKKEEKCYVFPLQQVVFFCLSWDHLGWFFFFHFSQFAC